MSKQNEIPDSIFDGIKVKNDTVIFESLEKKNAFKVDGKIPADVIKSHTLTVEFDFTGLTIQEACDQLASTTSFMKLFQNNIIGNVDNRWSEQEILDTVASGTYRIKVRDLLDNKKSRALTPQQKASRNIKQLKSSGLDKESIKAILEEELANLQ